MSLVVFGASVWTPTTVFAQTVPGSPFGGSASSGTSLPVADTQTIVSGSADATKLLRFEVDGFTTGTTRVATVPNADVTLAGQNFANAFTANQSLTAASYLYIDGVSDARNAIGWSGSGSARGFLGVSSTTHTWVVGETGDRAFNFTHSATQAEVVAVSNAQDNINYRGYSFAGSRGKTVKTLTESAATSTMRCSLAAEEGNGGMYLYSIYATDGSTPQIRQGRVIFSVTNDGGTETCVLGTPEETDNTPTGTLTVTVTCDTTPTNAVDIQLNAVSSLSQTTLEAYSYVELVGPGECVPQ